MALLDIIMARGDGPVLTGKAELTIASPPGRVYAVVSDVTRMGERSPECYRCEWLDGAAGPAVGARFRGYNRRGFRRWRTTCRVIEAQEGKAFAFAVVWPGLGRQSIWRYDLYPEGQGTRLVESFQVFWYFKPLFWLLFGNRTVRLESMEAAMGQTLEYIKAAAESGRQ